MTASTATKSNETKGAAAKAAEKNKGAAATNADKRQEAAATNAVANPPAGETAGTAVAKSDAAAGDSAKPAEVKLNAGEKAIAAAQGATCNNAQLLKALWSTRGAIYVEVAGSGGMKVQMIKSDLTNELKAAKADEVAKFRLVPRAGKDGGADLIPVQPASKK
jgi:hypothetical protein